MGSVGLIVLQLLLTIVVAVSTMMQGGGEGDVPRVPKRRADAVRLPAAADLPAGGIRLDPRAVPVLAFTGAPTGDDTKLEGTDAAVAHLGGKADAARLVAIVEAELARQDGYGGGGSGGGGDGGAGAQVKKAKAGRQPNRLTQALSAAADTVSHSQMQRLGGREDLTKNLRRAVEELTCHDGVLRYRRHWPWVNDAAKMPRLSVGRKDPRFLTPLFAGHDAVPPAFLTRAHVMREGDTFGMNLEEYFTPQEEVERLRAVLAYYDDGNMWRCVSGPVDSQDLAWTRDLVYAMAKEIVSFARANEPSPTGTWASEWPYAISTGADGDAATRIAWEPCQIVRLHTAAPLYEVRLRAQPDGPTLRLDKVRLRPKWQREGAVFVQSCSGSGVYRLGVAKDLITAYDTATLAGKLADAVAASRLQDELDAHRAATVRLLTRQPRNNAERQRVADYVGWAVGALVGAAPALMPPGQLGGFCKRSYSSLDSVTPITDSRCTPSSFIGAPRHTRRLMVEWYVERNTLWCWLSCLGERWLTCACMCACVRVCACACAGASGTGDRFSSP
jgi:hypothetical protein